jgi:copper chaperone
MIGNKKTFHVEGMSCEHCAERVKNALMQIEGIKSVAVNLKKKEVKIKFILEVPDNVIVKAVTEAGYQVVD